MGLQRAAPGGGLVSDLPDYRELVEPFVKAMVDELEANHYKGAPLPFKELAPEQAVGELFYHTLKVAYMAKHHPDEKVALRELTADVANCALIAALALKASTETSPDEPTIIRDPEFSPVVTALIELLGEHFGWEADALMAGVSG